CFSSSFRLCTWAGHNIMSLSAFITAAGSSNDCFDMTSERQPSGTGPPTYSVVALQPTHPHNTPAISLGLSNSPRDGFFPFIPRPPPPAPRGPPPASWGSVFRVSSSRPFRGTKCPPSRARFLDERELRGSSCLG